MSFEEWRKHCLSMVEKMSDEELVWNCLLVSAIVSQDCINQLCISDEVMEADQMISFEICRRFCKEHLPENVPTFCLDALGINSDN